MNIEIKLPEINALKGIRTKTDAEFAYEAFLEMPDLSRMSGSPINEIVENILKIQVLIVLML